MPTSWTVNNDGVKVTGSFDAPTDPGTSLSILTTDTKNYFASAQIDDAIDEIRGRFGEHAVVNACLMGDLNMATDRCETVPMPRAMYQ